MVLLKNEVHNNSFLSETAGYVPHVRPNLRYNYIGYNN